MAHRKKNTFKDDLLPCLSTGANADACTALHALLELSTHPATGQAAE